MKDSDYKAYPKEFQVQSEYANQVFLCKTSIFTRSKCVKLTADRIYFVCNLCRRPIFRSLKKHMLDKMRNSVYFLFSYREPLPTHTRLRLTLGNQSFRQLLLYRLKVFYIDTILYSFIIYIIRRKFILICSKFD